MQIENSTRKSHNKNIVNTFPNLIQEEFIISWKKEVSKQDLHAHTVFWQASQPQPITCCIVDRQGKGRKGGAKRMVLLRLNRKRLVLYTYVCLHRASANSPSFLRNAPRAGGLPEYSDRGCTTPLWSQREKVSGERGWQPCIKWRGKRSTPTEWFICCGRVCYAVWNVYILSDPCRSSTTVSSRCVNASPPALSTALWEGSGDCLWDTKEENNKNLNRHLWDHRPVESCSKCILIHAGGFWFVILWDKSWLYPLLFSIVFLIENENQRTSITTERESTTPNL